MEALPHHPEQEWDRYVSLSMGLKLSNRADYRVPSASENGNDPTTITPARL